MALVPNLQPPTTLLSHPITASSARVAVSGFASTKRASIAVGTAFKLSSDAHSLRRLKGLLPVLVYGQAVNLVNPITQTPIQSFALSTSDVPLSAPVSLLKSLGSGRSLRITYLALRSTDKSTEIRAYVEELSAKGKESAQVHVQKELLIVPGLVQLIQPLSDGRLVLTHSDDRLTVLSHSALTTDDGNAMQDHASLRIIDNVAAPDSYTSRFHFNVSLLDHASAKKLVSAYSRIEQAAVVGLRVSVSSASKLPSELSSSRKKRSKATKARKSNMADLDDQDTDAAEQGTVPHGPLEVDLVLFQRSFESNSSSDPAVRLGRVAIPDIADAQQVNDLALHPDGRLVILLRSGEIVSLTLQLSNDGPILLSHKSLLVPSLASSSVAYSSALLALSRDHVLVVGIVEQKAVALLLDLELDVALSQSEWPVPFSSEAEAAESMLSITRIAGSLVTIVMTPSPGSATGERRSSVLTMPFVVPEMSVLRHALGKGELTAKWLGQQTAASVDAVDESRATLLSQLRSLSSDTKRSAAVQQWAEQQIAQGKTLEAVSSKPNADFYASVMELLLPEGGAVAFSRDALVFLLEHKNVHSSVLTCLPDFWSRLRSKDAVELLQTAIRYIKDISEDDLVLLLAAVSRRTPRQENQALSTIAFLGEFVGVPVSRPALRSALKTHIRNVDDVVILLQICNVWLNAAAKKPLKTEEDDATPDATLVMTFASDVMDTFFPLLVSTASSYEVLRSLSKTISRYMSAINGLRTLSAPLSAFAKLDLELQMNRKRTQHQKNAALAASGTLASAGNAKVSAKSGGMRAETGGGLGLRLGTLAESKSKRLESFEQSMLVGAYTLERLEI